ncbi:sugar nucleotide-binding protein [Altererythrobacter confluentis]|uniref:Sugar nucleotide-binding protein n=1 Tax=Allopontixanthobacter confluentis TaxID=1849021 RepID=A0A6L7GI53_9SPHN|nr:SDR family oxidoreductase [Allopontixanthobacter confluentis]MXP14964.1 sugar nucleotide-binding protein [Allopontixanthobacter confluentis]
MLKIFLTGAAGLIGGEVASRLLAAGHQVTALVHQNRDIRANDGSSVTPGAVVCGDVSKPLLGFGKPEFDRLTAAHDLIIHCAATVRFDLDDDAYRQVNTGGAANAVEFARAGDMPLLHVSTAYVCGTRDGPILESDPLPDAGFKNGYEKSKAAAERLVRDSGVAFAIARPSIVVGDSATGAIRQFDTTYAAFKLIAEGRVRHMPARSGATLDFVPIDHVAGSIVDIAENMRRAAGGTFHLVSGRPVPVPVFTGAIAAFPQFCQPTLVEPEGFDPASLPPMERRLFRRVAGLYASYFQRDPHFDDREAQGVAGRICPPTGPEYLYRLIQFCIEAGFLRDGAPITERGDIPVPAAL